MRNMVFQLENAPLKTIGAVTTVAGIFLASISVLFSTGLPVVLKSTSALLAVWLSWFLLRNGLPPSALLVADAEQKIGLTNPVATRWFDLDESLLRSDKVSAYWLEVDGRVLAVSREAADAIARMSETTKTTDNP